MKYIALTFLLLFTLPVLAEANPEKMSRADLIELVKKQRDEIERLETKIAQLEGKDLIEEAEGQQDKNSGKIYRSVGHVFRDFPRDLLPDTESRWTEENQKQANDWLRDHVSGSKLLTQNKSGHGWRVREISSAQSRFTVLSPAYEDSSQAYKIKDAVSPVYWQKVHIAAGRRVELPFHYIKVEFKDKDLAWEVDKIGSEKPVLIEGVIKRASVSSSHPVSIDIELEPDPKVIPLRGQRLRKSSSKSIALP